MINESILTLVVTILSVDQGVATIDKGRLAGLRPDDVGHIYYQLTVGAETKRIDVGGGTLIEVEKSRSKLRPAGDADVRPGYLVEFEIPLGHTEAEPESAGVDPALEALIARLVPEDAAVRAEVARLIRERRLRSVDAGPAVSDREAELLKRTERLEAALDQGTADNNELREQLARVESKQQQLETDLEHALAGVADLQRQLGQAELAGQKLQDELAVAHAEVDRLEALAREPEVAATQVAATRVESSSTVDARAEPPPDPATEILAVVQDWARAWSEQRVDDYLAFYARGFRPPSGKSRGQWEAQRRPRILEPRFIEVTLKDLEILSLESGRAEIKLQQKYRSDVHTVVAIKWLELVQDDSEWKIASERIE